MIRKNYKLFLYLEIKENDGKNPLICTRAIGDENTKIVLNEDVSSLRNVNGNIKELLFKNEKGDVYISDKIHIEEVYGYPNSTAHNYEKWKKIEDLKK